MGADINVIEAGLADPRELRRFLEGLGVMLQRIEALDLPTIAAVNGLTRAGGFELLLACDIAIATDEAKIGDYHTPFGAMPGGGATQRAPRRVGVQRAFELIYTGRWLTGKEAEEYGIVLKSVPATALSETIDDLVGQLKDKSRDCLGYVKRAMREGLDLPLADGLRLEMDLLMEYLESSPDFREGVSAYREGRSPRFSI